MHSHRPNHENPTSADLDVLSLLTSDHVNLGPLSPTAGTGSGIGKMGGSGERPKRQLPRRESPLDTLLISAVLAGSGPVTRHHLGHGPARPGAYTSCDESRPTSPSRIQPEKITLKSLQAPRSERLRLEQEVEITRLPSSTNHLSLPTSTSPTDDTPRLSPDTPKSPSNVMRPKRKMSVDPNPVSQILQAAASPINTQSFPTQPQLQSLFSPSTVQSDKTDGKVHVKCMARTRIPTPHGEMFLHLYHNSVDSKEHLAIVYDPIQLSPEARDAVKGRKEIRSKSLDQQWRIGETEMERVVRGAYIGRLLPGGESQANGLNDFDMEDQSNHQDILPLVRIHSECFTGETIGSMRCDCGEQLDEAMRLISLPRPIPNSSNNLPTPAASRSPSPDIYRPRQVPGRGVVIYLRQEGRGIGLLEKIRAYNLQDLGHDTVTANLLLGHGADERKYTVAAEIMRDLGLAEGGISLLTNNPEKVEGLTKEGIEVKERVGMIPRDWKCDGQDEGYGEWKLRREGVGLIGAGKASGKELEKYLRTKVERMGHCELFTPLHLIHSSYNLPWYWYM
ncbi:hypothetical protein TREMEDRAFT_31049 [Tremella mesenterica DSM 1558]|uniref:uncharacterized protein n=1 Tax=Tremella mesenterica (strain ATCC 24925 / CBS 8224 / DSM 1558 / NBRC 9311 / NRRL Y-6157 / RJB 2259-6 / UBC 559-6) TaxID=578456 RepID=UPI0003F490CB|nr:uncharacterized protein TREMEDRAFT_31049 [Tremella mesenterica DSM 1558]EIW68881.1 hypothetical protein TREMEDRAFT_31049 [Tremella mesenterica DSM 1558]